jgi:hypothetical protein
MTKRFLALPLALLCCAAKISAATPTVANPENIVRQDVAALNRGDVDGVVALFSPDARVYAPVGARRVPARCPMASAKNLAGGTELCCA